MKKQYTFDQYKQMSESFNRQPFVKKIDIIRNNKDILVLGNDLNWFVVKVVDKEMREELDKKGVYFCIENEWDSREIRALLDLLGVPITDA